MPIGRVAGVTIRLHIVFIIVALVLVMRAWVGPSTAASIADHDPAVVALLVGCLFVVVLAHEFGHCLACRWTGGTAEDVLLWPLGGLAFCRPRRNWRAHLVTALGGPMVNVVVCL
ncbi:MAG: zinc metalloprotease, partial [Planctomycetota bacterium]